MKDNDYIKITRSILGWEWASSPDYFAVLIHCFLEASGKETRRLGKVIKPKSLATSYRMLSIQTGVSVPKIRKILKALEKGDYIKLETSNQNTIINLLCWDDFIVDTKISYSVPQKPLSLATEVVDLWNKTLGLRLNKNVLYLPPKNITEIQLLKKALPTIEDYKNLFERIEKSKLYIERDKYSWFSLPWLIDENRVLEILAGKWDMPESSSEAEKITFTEEEQKALDEKYYGN